jgi:excisionase family DNA binding protein
MADSLLRVPEVRRRLGGVSQAFVYKLFRTGRLPSVKLGRSRRVRESDLAAFIASLGQVIGAVFLLLLALAAELTPKQRAEVRAWVKRTRLEQGLSEHLEDRALLSELAADVAAVDEPAPAGVPTMPREIARTAAAALGTLDVARRALAEAETLPDVAALVDRAEVVRVAARKAQLSLEAQNDWAEYKLDAERKAGRMLAEMDLHGGDRRSESSSQRTNLKDLGINGDQSSRWQQLASVPDADYESYKTATRRAGEPITEAGALRAVRAAEQAEAAAVFESGLSEDGRARIEAAQLRSNHARLWASFAPLFQLDPERVAAVLDPAERRRYLIHIAGAKRWLSKLEAALTDTRLKVVRRDQA